MPALADERLEVGAYISMDEHLYHVLGTEHSERRGLVVPHPILICENCATEYTVTLDVIDVRRRGKLVKAAPAGAPTAPLATDWR